MVNLTPPARSLLSAGRCSVSFTHLRYLTFSSSWHEGTGCDKVPTQLQYEVSSGATPLPSRKRRAAGSYADLKKADVHVVKWGFPASKNKGSIQMLKLLLDPQQQLPPYVSRTQLEAQLKQIGRGAVEATADFFEKLKSQALEALDKRYGKAFMANTKIDYILTVPAVWSDAAKDATLRAAEMAGLHKSRNLQMITEPEAAGLYALKQMEGVTLAEGDTYIVCDAGGGMCTSRIPTCSSQTAVAICFNLRKKHTNPAFAL